MVAPWGYMSGAGGSVTNSGQFTAERRTALEAERAAAKAAAGIRAQFGKLVEKGRMAADAAEAAGARLRPVERLEDLADAALVVEAIVEKLDVKRALFRELEGLVAPDCVLATMQKA